MAIGSIYSSFSSSMGFWFNNTRRHPTQFHHFSYVFLVPYVILIVQLVLESHQQYCLPFYCSHTPISPGMLHSFLISRTIDFNRSENIIITCLNDLLCSLFASSIWLWLNYTQLNQTSIFFHFFRKRIGKWCEKCMKNGIFIDLWQ